MKLERYFLHTSLFLLLWAVEAKTAEGTMTYEKFFRLNSPSYQSDSGDWINFTYHTDQIKEEKKLDVYSEGALKLFFQDNNSLNYSLQEAYTRYIGEDFKLYVGRKILDWNDNEKYWSLGYLNANQAFTLLDTKQEGITGIIFNKEIGHFEFDILLSYVFVPQINPSVDMEKGKIKSKSDWVRLPPQYTVINNVQVPIYYTVSKINVSKIIFNKSLGGNVKYKWKNGGVSAFAIYKPENRLRINAEAYYDNLGSGNVIVNADPTVNHHAYYGVQVFQSFGDVRTRSGLSYVDPNAKLGKDFPVDISNARKTFKSEFFTVNPRYEKEAYSHVSAEVDRKKYALTLNYIHLITKSSRTNDDFYSDAVKWKRAFGGSILYVFNDRFNILLDMKYDIERFDNILKSEVKYNYDNKVNIALGLEMLKAPSNSSYWSYYRANDILYSSIGFYF